MPLSTANCRHAALTAMIVPCASRTAICWVRASSTNWEKDAVASPASNAGSDLSTGSPWCGAARISPTVIMSFFPAEKAVSDTERPILIAAKSGATFGAAMVLSPPNTGMTIHARLRRAQEHAADQCQQQTATDSPD